VRGVWREGCVKLLTVFLDVLDSGGMLIESEGHLPKMVLDYVETTTQASVSVSN
jgi:hypothetical protein